MVHFLPSTPRLVLIGRHPIKTLALLCDSPLSTNNVEDITVRVLEPSNFNVTGDVDIVLSPHVPHIVVLERDALGLERSCDIFHVLADHPCHCRGLVGCCLPRLIDIYRGVFHS
jgi:hypothetical protein